MLFPDRPASFRPEALSAREREVVDLAVLGYVDERIARELGVSPSTVNSYWVRIRGKLGPLSRTEIVGHLLRHESNLRFSDLIAENARLKAAALRAGERQTRAEQELHALGGTSWHALALDHTPEASVVCDEHGAIVYANLRAEHVYVAEPGALEGLCVWDLTIPEDQEARELATTAFFNRELAPRVVVGVERPYFVLRRDGTNFRGVLVAERFLAPQGLMAVVSVREYLEDVDAVLRYLRRPFTLL